MIRVAVRLALAGGRGAAVRFAFTVAGTACGVSLLLLALSFESAVAARAMREAQRGGGQIVQPVAGDGEERGGRGLLLASSEDRFRGRSVTQVFVAPEGPDAPVPPGLSRLPKTGEAFVSEGLAELLELREGRLLRPRLPGRLVSGQLQPAALLFPSELVAWVGVDPSALRASGYAQRIEGFPLKPREADWWRAKLAVRLGVAMGFVGLLVPCLALVGTMSRLGAAQRERRLASLRLLGATPRQVRLTAVVEAVLASTAGAALGTGSFLALRVAASRIPVNGAQLFPSDFTPPSRPAVCALVAVPILAAATAALALRRVNVSPLGVAQRERRSTPSRVGAVACFAGFAGLVAASMLSDVLPTGRLVLLAASSLALVVAALPFAGPRLTSTAGRLLAERARRLGPLLAGRRLGADPAGAFRPVAGAMAAVFLATVFYGYSNGNIGESLTAAIPHGDRGLHIDAVGADPEAVAEFLQAAADVPGVESTLAVRYAYGATEDLISVNVADCEQLRDYGIARFDRCPQAHAFVSKHGRVGLPSVFRLSARQDSGGASATVSAPGIVGAIEHGDVPVVDRRGILSGAVVIDPALLPGEFVDALPVRDVFIETDGPGDVVERVRNLAVPLLPGHRINTREALAERNNRPIREAERAVHVVVALILLVAGASMTSTAAAAALERLRPFALLRASGVPFRALSEMLMLEVAVPLALAAGCSLALGLATSRVLADIVDAGFHPPLLQIGAVATAAVGAGVAMSASILPLMNHATLPTRLRAE